MGILQSTEGQGNKMPKINRKILVMGDRGVGKTAIVCQFVEKKFIEQYTPTFETTVQRNFTLRNTEYMFEIIDSAGQDEFSIFQQQYSVGIDGYVLVYALNNPQSFEMVQLIHEKLLNAMGTDTAPCVLVGNKLDLEGKRKVNIKEGQDLAKKWKCAFVEGSAKNDVNIDEIFKAIIAEIEKE